MRKITLILILSAFFSVAANAGTDGDNSLSSKNNPGEVKDCFEKVNRGVFAFNQALDKTIFKPVAKGYRYIPSPIRKGTGNAMTNLSNLITVPNNLLQGDVKAAGVNTVRFVVNTTVGILGIFDPAAALGFKKKKRKIMDRHLADGEWVQDVTLYFLYWDLRQQEMQLEHLQALWVEILGLMLRFLMIHNILTKPIIMALE